jgi:hypothetical protein
MVWGSVGIYDKHQACSIAERSQFSAVLLTWTVGERKKLEVPGHEGADLNTP